MMQAPRGDDDVLAEDRLLASRPGVAADAAAAAADLFLPAWGVPDDGVAIAGG